MHVYVYTYASCFSWLLSTDGAFFMTVIDCSTHNMHKSTNICYINKIYVIILYSTNMCVPRLIQIRSTKMYHSLWLLRLFLFLLVLIACAQVAGAPQPGQRESGGEEGNGGVLSWLRGHGGTARGVEVTEFPSMGRGFLATRDIQEGEVVLEVPSNIIFSLKSALRSDDLIHRRIAGALSRDQELAVAALLLLERARGEASAWAPYIKVLPGYVPNGASEGFAVSELQNPQLERDVNRSIAALQSKFGLFRRALASEWPEELPLPELADLRWAASIVDSRALRFQGQVNLIPVADIFNFRSHPVPRRRSGGDFFLAHHRLSGDEGLQVTADRQCKEGEQLFEDYGDNEDSIYLQYHGFVADENPFRCVDVQVGPPDSSVVSGPRHALLESLRLNTTLKKCVDASGEVGLGILVYLAVQDMGESEAEKCLDVVLNNKNDWNTIFVQCNFIQVQVDVAKYLETVIPEVNRLLLAPLASVEPEMQSPPARELLDASRSSLRVLDRLRSLMDAAVASLPTSLAQDREILSSVNNQLGGMSASPSAVAERQELMKRALSLRYRIATKTHWKRLCCIYGASCCHSEIAPLPTKENEIVDQRRLNSAANSSCAPVSELDAKLASFMKWFLAAGPATCKLRAAVIPGFRIGTIATSPICAKEEYLSVPTSIIMDARKASGPTSGVAALIRALAEKFPKSKDAFHELLFFLIHEYFVLGSRSFFWPYLSLLPVPAEMPIPVMWEQDDDVHSRLGPSVIAASVSSYRSSIRRLFDSISRIDLVKNFFQAGTERDVFNFDNYRWATAILDSRSIWWGGERHLVPLLDFVNCAQGPSAHTVHATALDESETFAVTRAGWDFAAGDQVFEHYGQPNHIYFMYHGFVLPDNVFDCVSVEVKPGAEEVRSLEAALARTPRLKEVMQLLRIRDVRSGMAVCLKPAAAVPDSLWAFLSVLSGEAETHLSSSSSRGDNRGGMAALGNPSPATAARLLDIVDGKIRDYRDFFANRGIVFPESPADVGRASEGGGATPWLAFLQTEALALQGVRAVALATRSEVLASREKGEL